MRSWSVKKNCGWLSKLIFFASLLLSLHAWQTWLADTVSMVNLGPSSTNFGPSSAILHIVGPTMHRALCYVPLFLMVISITMAAFRLPTGQSTVAPRPPHTHRNSRPTSRRTSDCDCDVTLAHKQNFGNCWKISMSHCCVRVFKFLGPSQMHNAAKGSLSWLNSNSVFIP